MRKRRSLHAKFKAPAGAERPAYCPGSGRLTSTWSTRPNSFAASAVMKLSRSSACSTAARSWPVVLHIDLVEASLQGLDLAGVDQDVGRLALEAAGRLVDHDAGVGQGEAVPLLAGAEQERAHRGRLPDAQRRHRAADELHGVVDRQPRGHDPARRVDVEGDLLLRVLGLEEEELRDDERGRVVLDRTRSGR